MKVLINPNPFRMSFKAQNTKLPSRGPLPEEMDLIAAFRQGRITPDQVSAETGETVFYNLVKQGYFYAVGYLTAKKDLPLDVINYPCNGKTPLDISETEEMSQLLLQRGAMKSSELSKDAREIATRMYMSNPIIKTHPEPKIQSKDETKTNKQEPKIINYEDDPEGFDKVLTEVTAALLSGENNSVNEDSMKTAVPEEAPKVDYFNSFDEIVEETSSAEPIVVAQEDVVVAEETLPAVVEEVPPTVQTHPPVNQAEKPNETELKKLPNALKQYKLLEIKPSDPKSLEEIIGYNDVKQELSENIVTPIISQTAAEALKANKIDLPNGILLNQVDNSIDLIKAIAYETSSPVLLLSGINEFGPMLNDIESVYKNDGTRTIVLAQGFDKFFDNMTRMAEQNNFRLQLQNCNEKGVIFIATTNDKDSICKDFLKSGIFDKVIEMKNPTIESRAVFLEQYFREKQLFNSLHNKEGVKEFAELTEAFSWADINRVLEEAARVTVSNNKTQVEAETLREELKSFAKERGITPVDKWNKTAMYDTPEFQRVPVVEGEMMTLDELGGMPEVKQMLKDLYIEPMKNLDKLRAVLGPAAMPDGAIFWGGPGNGKTLTAKVLARELGLPFYETKLSQVGTSLVHETSKNLKTQADQLARKFRETGEMSVWFLDEFEALGGDRNTNSSRHDKEVTDTLLQEFNNPSQRGCIIIAATNDIESVDPALKRRGRLGNWIEFSNPNADERKDTIRKELAKAEFTREMSTNEEILNKLVKEFDGNSQSNIVSSINDAKRLAILKGMDFVEAVKLAIDNNTKREMAEFCNKAGLKQHEYGDADFKSFDELGGMDDIKQALQENVIDIWNPEIRQALLANKRSLPGGVILEGPAGTGKTTIIETLAREMDIPLFKMNYSQEGNEYIHGVSRNVTDIFNRLALQSRIIKKPVMLFFDEAEKFFPRHAERHQVEEVNTYIELMNTAAAAGIILVAATNHIDQVNQEITGNPRRMGTVIHVGYPDLENRKSLFGKLLANLPIIHGDISKEIIAEYAELTDGLSIGKIVDMVDKAITQAVKTKINITPESLKKVLAEKAPTLVRR